MEEVVFSHWNRYVFWIWFFSPVHNASASTTIHQLTKCLIHYRGIAHNITSVQGTYITEKNHDNGLMPIELTSFTKILSPRNSLHYKTVKWPTESASMPAGFLP